MSLLPDFFLVQVGFAPLPFPLVGALREIEVECAVDRAAAFRMHFALSRTAWGDLDALALPLFRPLTPITIRVAFGLGVPQTLINGFVQDVRLQVGDAAGAGTLEVTGSDKLGTLMALVEQPMLWPSAPAHAIASALFLKYAVTPAGVTPTPPTRTVLDTTTTQRVSDAAFLLDLARPLGFQCFIQPEPVSGVDQGHFHLPVPPPVSQGTLSADFGMATNLSRFEVGYDMLRPTAVAGVASDPRTRAPVPVAAPVAADLPAGLEPALNRILPPPVQRDTAALDAANPAEAVLHALGRTTATSRAIRATGEVDAAKFGRVLLVGLPVAVRGAGREHSGYYAVERVTHRISRDGYAQSFVATRNAVGLSGAELFVDPLAAVA